MRNCNGTDDERCLNFQKTRNVKENREVGIIYEKFEDSKGEENETLVPT